MDEMIEDGIAMVCLWSIADKIETNFFNFNFLLFN